MKRVLIACECSGIVREAFRAAGCDAWSCDLKQAEDGSPNHIQGDALAALRSGPWHLVIAHPSCVRLCLSGVLRLYVGGKKAGGIDPQKWAEMEAAAAFFRAFATEYAGPLCIENPLMHGHARRLVGLPEFDRQTVQPWQFGDDASKRTVLWLRGLPRLRLDQAQAVSPRLVNGLPRWANQTDSGQNRLPPSPNRSADRARTYSGIARAMAAQWAHLI